MQKTDEIPVNQADEISLNHSVPQLSDSSIKEPIRLKRPRMGQFWRHLSGVLPNESSELIQDVDPHQPQNQPSTAAQMMSYDKTKHLPVFMERITNVCNLLLLAYNENDSFLYQNAGIAFGAQINLTICPSEPSIQMVKLNALKRAIQKNKIGRLHSWCTHEYPRTMEFLASEGYVPFYRGLRAAYMQRLIHIPNPVPCLYQVEVE